MSQPELNLQHARDIRMFWALNRSSVVVASVFGQVVRRNSRGGVIYFSLRDPSGIIDCSADKSNFSPDAWNAEIKSIRKGDRISIKGTVRTHTSQGRSRPLIEIQAAQRTLTPSETVNADSADFLATESGFFLARLKRAIADGLLRRGFDEFEPRYIHNIRPPGNLEPLQVVFPGFGSPAYLLVSPIPDLQSVALVTGVQKLFSVARSYTQTVRDGYTSAESLVVGMFVVGKESERLSDLCIDLVSACFGDYTTMARNWGEYALIDSWEHAALPASATAIPCVGKPTVLHHDATAFALAWPRPPVTGDDGQEALLVAEGSAIRDEAGSAIGSAIIHIERMARAIEDDITLRG